MSLIKPRPGEIVDRQTILQLKITAGSSGEGDPKVEDQMVKGTPDPEVQEDKIARTVLRDKSPINIQPFVDEHELLQRHLEANWFPSIAADTSRQTIFDRLFDSLAETNKTLWSLEDQIRILVRAPDKDSQSWLIRVAEVALAIAQFNDKRADLVKHIDAIWNVSVEEKIYA